MKHCRLLSPPPRSSAENRLTVHTGLLTAGCSLSVLLLALPTPVLAGSATVSFSVPGLSGPITPQPTNTAVTVPIFNTIQNNTELTATTATQPSAEAAEASGTAKPQPIKTRASIGVDTYWSDKVKIYNIPASWSFTPDFVVKLDFPVVTAKYAALDGSTRTETNIGDMSLSAKYRLGSENTLESHTLVTAKFATGDKNKGLGTGSYDIALTEKLIKRIADFRITLMGGFNQPLNEPKIQGYKVTYGTTVSYMAALEHKIVWPQFWGGVRASGIHAFEGKINGLGLNNATTILDINPELKYFFGEGVALSLGVAVPIYTKVADNTANNRDVTVNFGVFKSF